MSLSAAGSSSTLRLWPGVAAVTLQWILRFAVPAVFADATLVAFIGGLAGGVVILLWWAFFSKAPLAERWGAVMLMALAMFLTRQYFLDKSLATGMMGLMFFMYAVPVVSLALVAWAVLGSGLPSVPLRWATLAGAIALACGGFALLRTNGITGEAASDFAWRWSKTHEERLLEVAPALPVAPAVVPAPVIEAKPVPIEKAVVAADWPGFRGAGRDGIVSGIKIATDWAAHKPVQLWKKPIGPGWSSFALRGDLLYTQEQRGEDELVGCYRASTGEPVWIHKDAARFWESNAGAGPRGTPTLHEGAVFSLGATGILNALNADTGAVLWTHNAAAELKVKTPGWGFSSSPLVREGLVIVAVSGQLVAYEMASGALKWTGPADVGGSYSSPALMSFDGVPQVVLTTDKGAMGVSPEDGRVLWKHAMAPNGRIVQPALTVEGDLLVEGGEASTLVRIAVVHVADGAWTTEERWTSTGLKPYFNDFVVLGGYAYGFDNGILACVELKDGKRVWKGGRYGHGQFVLLKDSGVFLVLSEEGELALVKASAEGFVELGKVAGIEGKTWNHPVVSGDRLFVRNGTEMAAFRLGVE